MPKGNYLDHTDNAAPSSASVDEESSTEITYAKQSENTDLGPVTDRGTDIHIEHPVDDIETLRERTHLEMQLHDANRSQWNKESFPDNDGTTLYDMTLIDVAPATFEPEGIHPSQLDIPKRRLLALFLKYARQLPDAQALLDYLQTAPDTRKRLGYESEAALPSYDTLREELENRLPDELDDGLESLSNASVRATYAVVRNGVHPPAPVDTRFGFEAVRPPLSERSVEHSTKRQAIRNWVRMLASETLDPLTFDRTRPTYSMLQLLGLFATSALTGAGLQTAAELAQWDHDRSLIPKGTAIPKYIKNLSIPGGNSSLGRLERINAQFDAVHRKTLAVASDRGFFSDSKPVAVDGFRIEWTGSEDAPTIRRPAKAANDVRSEWTFLVAELIDNQARFTLGTRWIRQKDEFSQKLLPILSSATDLVGLNSIYADSEFASGSLINCFRHTVGDRWVISAPNSDRIETLRRLTPANYIGVVESISWNCSPKPGAVAYPYDGDDPDPIAFTSGELNQATPPKSSSGQTTLSDRSGETANEATQIPLAFQEIEDLASQTGVGRANTHAAYLTDRDISKGSAAHIHSFYNQRWAVEGGVNQIKNHMMPVVQSQLPARRLYGVNLAILFQNWHTLIKRAPSPKLGLRLNATHHHLLKAIQHVAFQDRS